MLYYMYDLSRTALHSWTPAAAATRAVFAGPFSPFAATYGGRAMAAFGEIVERGVRRSRPPRLIVEAVERGDGTTLAIQRRIVERRPFGQLVRLAAHDGRRRRPAVLVVNPLSGHFSVLLEDLYRGLLATHDVYVAEWRDARLVPLAAGRFGLDDQIAYVVDYLARLGPGAHVVGFSQSTVPALAAAALAAQADSARAPASLSLIAGPVDPRVAPSPLGRILADRPWGWFEQHVITEVPVWYPGAMRRVYPGFLQLGGYVSASLEHQIGRHLAYFETLVRGDGDGAERHRDFFDRFHAVMDLPAEFFADMVARVFRKAELAAGTLCWRGRAVDLAALRKTALLTVEAGDDVLVGAGQTHAAHALCPGLPESRRARFTRDGAGHLDVVHGAAWRADILPRLADFIARHDRRSAPAR